MKWFLKALKQYADFRARARRKEFWFFAFFWFVFAVVAALVDYDRSIQSKTIYYVGGIYFLVTTIPAVAVVVRRLHDTGKTGWWSLLLAIPYIGWAVLAVLLCYDSQPNENKWGENPKGIAI